MHECDLCVTLRWVFFPTLAPDWRERDVSGGSLRKAGRGKAELKSVVFKRGGVTPALIWTAGGLIENEKGSAEFQALIS